MTNERERWRVEGGCSTCEYGIDAEKPVDAALAYNPPDCPPQANPASGGPCEWWKIDTVKMRRMEMRLGLTHKDY